MSTSKEYLFVYGTLMQTSKNPNHQVLKKYGCSAGSGKFQGKLFMVADYPGVVPSQDPADLVTGELYTIKNTTPLFCELDAYEGVHVEEPEGSLYRREKNKIFIPRSGKSIISWIYVYNRPIRGLTPIRSGNFLEYLHNS